MLKHDACAAAINSSGFEPFAFSNRDGTEYGKSFKKPLCVVVAPCPSFKPPFQTARPSRLISGIRKFLLAADIIAAPKKGNTRFALTTRAYLRSDGGLSIVN